MANTFREQAVDRFNRSSAFMSKAESLLQDDLVNRSALADAVSAIKNMLQGYLLLRVSETPPSAVTQRWQEIAASNSMPDLIHCCGDAGLNLGGLAHDIKLLNRERNQRMHDDPARRIDALQAKTALELARTVQKRIKGAVQGEAVAESATPPAAVQRIAAVTRAAVSGRLGRDLLKSVTAAPAPLAPAVSAAQSSSASAAPLAPSASGTSPAGSRLPTQPPAGASGGRPEGSKAVMDPVGQGSGEAIPPPPEMPAAESPVAVDGAQPDGAAPVGDEPAHVSGVEADARDGDGESDAADAADAADADSPADTGDLGIVVPIRRRRGLGFVLLRAVAVAAVLVVGVAAGAGLTVPVMEGRAPSWLGFASNVLPVRPTATIAVPTATPAPAPVPPNGPLFAGAFMVDTPACAGAGTLALALHNAGTTPATWAAGSPDSTGVSFALKVGSAGTPTLAGTLAAGGSATLYVANASGSAYHVVLIAPDGTIQLLARAC